jgi:predicted SAM-dependent methyltransferase
MNQVTPEFSKKLNLGCGSQVVDGWVNVDYALGARLARIPFFRAINRKARLFDLDWNDRIFIHDLAQRFPWHDDSIDLIYSSHTLEHFTREDGRAFLKECCRVLRKGAIIRIVVPDLSHVVSEYSLGRIRADEFVEKLDVLYRRSRSPIRTKLGPFLQSPHKCMYDEGNLLTVLRELGFMAEGKKPFDSNIADILQLELASRTEHAVIVEGRKL